MRSRDPVLLPRLSALSLDAFTAVLARKPVLTWLANSAIVTVGATFISLVISTLPATVCRVSRVARNRARLRPAGVEMLPSSLIVIPFFIGFSTFGLIDSRWGLIVANAAVGVPFATWLMKGFFDGIPREIELAAMLDGCSACRRYVRRAAAVQTGDSRRAAFISRCHLVGLRIRAHPRYQSRPMGAHGRHAIVPGEISGRLVEPDGSGLAGRSRRIRMFLLLEPFLVSGMTQGAVAN